MKLKKILLAASLALVSLGAMAQQTDDPAQDSIDPAASTDWALTANINLASSYRFRGIDQTFNQPAVQGGIDLAMPYGFYVGNWNSNVNGNAAGFYGGNLEVDLYGGWKYAFSEDLGTDIGVINYMYPGSNNANNPSANIRGSNTFNPNGAGLNSGMVDNFEVYFGGTWKSVNLKQFFALTPYFNNTGMGGKSTAGSGYTDLRATYDLSDVHPKLAGFGLLGHVGYFYMANYSQANYADWELGATKDFGSGWNAKVSYIQAATQGNCNNGVNSQYYCFSKQGNGYGNSSTENAGHATYMITVGRSF